MKIGKNKILIILTAILILLMIGFFLYLRIEKFDATTAPAGTIGSSTTAPQIPVGCPTTANQPVTSITSYVAEYTIDVEPTNDGTGTYFLKYYGTDSNTPTGILAIDADNKLVVQILNDTRPGLINKWYLNQINGPNILNCVVSPVMCSSESDCIAKSIICLTFTSLYMDSTVLAVLPFTTNPIKENQIWLMSSTKVSNKNKLIIGNPSSIAAQLGQTISGPIDLTQLSLNQENESKLKDVLNLISQNLQSYKSVTSSDSGAALSQANSTPIKINLALTGSTLGSLIPNHTGSSQSFTDVTTSNTINQGDVRALLATYENNQQSAANTSDSVYTLDTALGSTISCPRIDSADYAVSRVGQCNCDLSGLTK